MSEYYNEIKEADYIILRGELTMPVAFNKDTSMRFSFRSGDKLIWFRFKNIFATESLTIVDLWKLSDGDHALLTNRWEDIPSWFELHPTEVQNSFAYKMIEKLNNSYKPGEIMDGPNIWRVNAGDTIVWLGKSRSDIQAIEGVLSVIKFNCNALLLGESTHYNSVEEMYGFGSMQEYSEDEVKEVRNVAEKLRGEGIPRTYSMEWRLG